MQSKYFRLPTGAVNGYILKTDGIGNASWINPSTLVPAKIQDADGNTRIHTEEVANENNIRFTLNGTLKWMMQGNRLEPKNTGNSTFIGEHAGLVEDGNERYNVGIGSAALASTTSGHENVAVGYYILADNNTGRSNVAVGYEALHYNTTGIYNVAVGSYALGSNETGYYNTAVGFQSLVANNANNNSAFGIGSLYANTNGTNNVAIGADAGANNVTGSRNIFIGSGAGANELGGDKLYIESSTSSTPLIYGDFAANAITINGTFTTNGALGYKFKNTQTAGTNNPDATATIWRFSAGTGSISLPIASTCANRTYIITNNTGSTRTITTYRDATGTNQTTITNNTILWLVSDGSEWWLIK